jgi:hypothetical protein
LGQGHRRGVDTRATHVARAYAILENALKAWLRAPLLILFSYLLLASPAAFGAIAIDGAASTGTTTTNSVTISHTTSGTSRLMLVGVSIVRDPAVPTVSSITYNGVNLSLVGARSTSDNFARIEIWQLTEADGLTTGTHDVVVNLIGPSPNQGVTVGVMTFTGVNQATPLGPFASDINDSSAASVITVVSGIDELVFDTMVLEKSSNADLIPDASQTERWDLWQPPVGNGSGSTKPATGGSELNGPSVASRSNRAIACC